MSDETASPAEGSPSTAPAAQTPGAPEATVRGILQEAIQKIMDEIGHHEQEARRHLQLAEALRQELQEGFKIARQEARAKSATGGREPADGTSEPAATDPAVPQPARAGARKRLGGRKMRGKK